MTKVLLLGAGKIGRMIASFLSHSGDYQVCVADANPTALAAFARYDVTTAAVDVSDPAALDAALAGQDMVISACPYTLTPVIATAAKKAGVHYFDLTEDVAATRVVKELAKGAETALMPQCGLAPGFISIAAADLAKRFETIEDLHLRVGALPKFPSNALKYNLTWSTDGLINEYCNPCEALVDGALREVAPLEGYERFALDGVDYEAFNTSGGLGTLHETLAGKVQNLNYRTVRYPGHLEIVKLLVNELKLKHRRDILKEVFEAAIPMTVQDVVLVFVTASGRRNGQFVQESFLTKIYSAEVHGEFWSAIQISTAAGICAAVDLVRSGTLPQKGFLRQEQIELSDFRANRFGRYYGGGECLDVAA